MSVNRHTRMTRLINIITRRLSLSPLLPSPAPQPPARPPPPYPIIMATIIGTATAGHPGSLLGDWRDKVLPAGGVTCVLFPCPSGGNPRVHPTGGVGEVGGSLKAKGTATVHTSLHQVRAIVPLRVEAARSIPWA